MVRLLALLALTASLAIPAAASARTLDDSPTTLCVRTTQLLAQNEVPPTASQASGATRLVIRSDNSIEFRTVIMNPARENFIAGHIHLGPVGVSGNVVQPLPFDATHEPLIVLSGVIQHVTTHLILDLCGNPQFYYVNYHTSQFTGGAIRGQLG